MTDNDSNDKKTLHQILTSSSGKAVEPVRGIGGVLAGLWRNILIDLPVKPMQFEVFLNDFVEHAKRSVPESRVSKHFTRGNLRREFSKPTMTFKVFIKAMRFLKIKHITINVELKHSNGKRTIHQTAVDLGNTSLDDMMESETSQEEK